MKVKNYLLHSTVISLFTEAMVTRFIIDLKLFYLIIIINFFVLLILNRVVFSKWILLIYTVLFVSGILSVATGTNRLPNFLSQWVGILFVSSYFYTFIRCYGDDFENAFRLYVKYCFAIAILGFVLFAVKIPLGRFEGLHSILAEPAHYSAITLPAFFYSWKDSKYPRYICITLLVSIVLSGSSLGFMGLGLAVLLSPKKIKPLRLFAPAMAVALLLVPLYYSYPSFKLRIDDTVKSVSQNDLTGVNLSTYALVSNLFVTMKSFSNNPLLGSGLGSHEISRSKYLESLAGIEEFENYTWLNAKDANSLLLRVLSDLGLLGIFGILYFLTKNYTGGTLQQNKIFLSRAVGLYFFCKLMREGHYFSPEMYFFVIGYFQNYQNAVLKSIRSSDLESVSGPRPNDRNLKPFS